MLALKLKKITFIAGLSFGVLFIVIGVALMVYRWKKHSKKKTETLLEKNENSSLYTDIDTGKEEDLN